jgi:hypothetical protein
MSDKQRNPLRRLASSIRDMQERHRERHRPSGFGFAFADRVDYLHPERWDAVTNGASIFLRRDILRVIEQHGPENIEPRYALVFRGDKPVAAVVTQMVTVTRAQFKRGDGEHNHLTPTFSPKGGEGEDRKSITAKWSERMLVAGNLLSWGFHGIAFASDEKPKELWPGVAEALYRIRRAARLSGETNLVMLKDVTPEQSGLESLRRFSYRPMETEPNMVLAIDPAWRTYEDYLGALDAKYRRNAKDQLKKLTASGCHLERLEDLAPHTRRLHDLYLAVHGNASIRLVTLRESYLPALSRVAGADFRCTAVRRGDEILGFVTTLRDGDGAIGYYIGFDRAAQAEGCPLYLRLLHTTIGDAIEWRCKRLSLGRTALEPKAGLGAKPEPMSVWLRHRVPALNWMLRGLLGAVPHAEAPERTPFKARNSTEFKE